MSETDKASAETPTYRVGEGVDGHMFDGKTLISLNLGNTPAGKSSEIPSLTEEAVENSECGVHPALQATFVQAVTSAKGGIS